MSLGGGERARAHNAAQEGRARARHQAAAIFPAIAATITRRATVDQLRPHAYRPVRIAGEEVVQSEADFCAQLARDGRRVRRASEPSLRQAVLRQTRCIREHANVKVGIPRSAVR